MFPGNDLYTSLTSTQLAIGLLVGFTPVVLTIIARRMRECRFHGAEHGVRDGVDRSRTLVDLSTRLRACYYTLGVLSARREPVLFWTAVHEVVAVQKLHQDLGLLSAWEISAALERLKSHGFVRAEQQGFVTTDAGRALYKQIGRLAGASIPEAVQRASRGVDMMRPAKPRRTRGEVRTRDVPLRRARRPRLWDRR